jgi:hypothetical protein
MGRLPYIGGMHRFVGASTVLLCASLAAGCGGSHVRPTAVPVGLHRPPAWLTKIVAREDRLLNDRNPHGGTSYSLSKQKDVIVMFGHFTTPPPAACTTSYCPVPVRLHGTSLRLVISPRTHRLLSATLSQRIGGNQAPAIAQRSSRVLHIFPRHPGKVACSIPRGGSVVITQGRVNTTHPTLRGSCMTAFVSRPPYRRGSIRIFFGERWGLGGRLHHAAWIVTVRLRDGQVVETRVMGQPPQLWK